MEPFQRIDRCASFPYTRGEYARKALWMLVQRTLFRIGVPRSSAWQRFLLRLFGARISPRSRVNRRSSVWHPWLLTLGEYTSVSRGVVIYNLGPVSIGDQTVLSQDVFVCAGTHDHTRPDLPLQRPPITIGCGVWIAVGAFIGPGVTVGDNSVVGARAVVVKDVPQGVIVAGNPARQIKARLMHADDTEMPAARNE